MFQDRNKPFISTEAINLARKNLIEIISTKYEEKDSLSINALAIAYLDFIKNEKGVELNRNTVNMSNIIQKALDDCVIGPDANRKYFIDIQKVMNTY